jgi:preprotein translocase subunit YajC
MRFFPDDIETEVQARLNYKRLAVLYHPDRGGNEEIMREINREYNEIKKQLRKRREGLLHLKPGDRVIVNGTECEVTAVFEKTFIAKAKGRHRLAIFDKETGYAVYDKKYIARLPR